MLKVGDIVNIIEPATYWDGTPIPEYIIRIAWRVSGISNDRVMLGRSATGTLELNKPIHRKYLIYS